MLAVGCSAKSIEANGHGYGKWANIPADNKKVCPFTIPDVMLSFVFKTFGGLFVILIVILYKHF